MNATAEAGKRLEIRKYANRRYYDSTHSRHLTLEEIRSLVEQGYDIQVIDAKTKADITGQVLLQIILELDTVKLDSLPVPLLVHLIRVNDQVIKHFVDNYLYKALRAFTDYHKQWQERIRSAQPFAGPFPDMSSWTSAVLRSFDPFGNRPEPAEPQPDPEMAAGGPNRQENVDLREMIERLQKQVSRLQNRSGPRRKPAGKRKRKK